MLSLISAVAGIVFVSTGASAQGQCLHPAPAKEFSNDKYQGYWYEIAKIQTWGGAIFESSCVCTNIYVVPKADGNYRADNVCRDKTPQGKVINASGTLLNEGPPGRWEESFFGTPPGVNYTAIILETMVDNSTGIKHDVSVEYDCGASYLGTNYCIHVLSRKPTLPQSIVDNLFQRAEAMGLNTQNLPVKMTKQDGCW